ncbi:hypothetical protein CDCA_CDCA14G3771 [Cyanidium caldarium]|uniref:tRNA(Ile)-lysidine/2-thiocytidine synthase N-terminal domain-containing protein n=1 Tax=Cyanidium caldarium TaxID=2771 RepID=A0AAV9J0D5_CYACA|nr:hypothetical protein CDCA_CDCA14G3771 [Cyanidium caldarium]
MSLTVPEFGELLRRTCSSIAHPSLRGILVGVRPREAKATALALLTAEYTRLRGIRCAAVYVASHAGDAADALNSEWAAELAQRGVEVKVRTLMDDAVRSPPSGVAQAAMAAADGGGGTWERRRDVLNQWNESLAAPAKGEHSMPTDASATRSRHDNHAAASRGLQLVARVDASDAYRWVNGDAFSDTLHNALEKRWLRYRELTREAVRQELDVVLVGHALDDQAEMFMRRFLHASRIDGMAGHKARVPCAYAPMQFPMMVRPLLTVSERRLLQTCVHRYGMRVGEQAAAPAVSAAGGSASGQASAASAAAAASTSNVADDTVAHPAKERILLAQLDPQQLGVHPDAPDAKLKLFLPPLRLAAAQSDAAYDETEQALHRCIEFSSQLGYVVLRRRALAEASLTPDVGVRALQQVLTYVGGRMRNARNEALERIYEHLVDGERAPASATLMGCLIKPLSSLDRIGAFLHRARRRMHPPTAEHEQLIAEIERPFEGGRRAPLSSPSQRSAGVASRRRRFRPASGVLTDGGEDRSAFAVEHLEDEGIGETAAPLSETLPLPPPSPSPLPSTFQTYPRVIICRTPPAARGGVGTMVPVEQCVQWDRRFLVYIERLPAASFAPASSAKGDAASVAPPPQPLRFNPERLYRMMCEALQYNVIECGRFPSKVAASTALHPSPSDDFRDWFRVRQLCPHDWTQLTAWQRRLKWTAVPYVCRFGLPAFEDRSGLVAVPHFGYNRRSDLRFHVFFAPVNRTMPVGLDRCSTYGGMDHILG